MQKMIEDAIKHDYAADVDGELFFIACGQPKPGDLVFVFDQETEQATVEYFSEDHKKFFDVVVGKITKI